MERIKFGKKKGEPIMTYSGLDMVAVASALPFLRRVAAVFLVVEGAAELDAAAGCCGWVMEDED